MKSKSVNVIIFKRFQSFSNTELFQCDMTCPTPSALANHIRYKHLVEKPFKCELCEYAGKTQHDVKAHLKVHYEEVELACTEPGCPFRCRAQQTMKKHFLKAAISKNVLVFRSVFSFLDTLNSANAS